MRIAISAQPLIGGNFSGIGYYCLNVVKELQKRGDCELFLEYFSMRNTQKKEQYLRNLLNFRDNTHSVVCRFFTNRFYMLLTAVLPVPRGLFFRTKPDISLFMNYFLPPFAKGKKVVVIHDMAMKDYPGTLDKKNAFVLKLHLSRSIKRADLIVTISEFSRQRIEHYFPDSKGKIAVIYNGIDHEKFRPCEDFPRISEIKNKYKIRGKYLLYLGTLEPRKNITRLIEGYNLFQKETENPPVLVIAGAKGWLYESIFDKVNSLGISDRIIFTGRVPDEEIVPLLSGAELFCFPSLYEGFGLPVLEAMACGTPVLTADNSSLPEVGGDACFYCNAENTNSIAESLGRIISDEKLRENMREKGLIQAKKFGWNITAEHLFSEIKKLLGAEN